MQDQLEDFTSSPTRGFSPPKTAVRSRTAWRETTLPSKSQLWYPFLTPKGCVGRQGFSTAPGSAWTGSSKHSASQGASAEGRKAPSPSNWRPNASKTGAIWQKKPQSPASYKVNVLRDKQLSNRYCWEALCQGLPWKMGLLKSWHPTEDSEGAWPCNNEGTNYNNKVCSWKKSL